MTQEIENFHASIEGADKLYIYYCIGENEVEKVLDIEVDSCDGYPATRHEPECPPEAEITKVFGMSIQEEHAFDKWSLENDLEPELLEALGEQAAADEMDAADYYYEQMRDRKIEEMM